MTVESMEFLCTVVPMWIILALVPAIISQKKGRSAGQMFLLSLLLSPVVGLIVALVQPPVDAVVRQQLVVRGTMRTCPWCAELIRTGAIVCRYCNHTVQIKCPACHVSLALVDPSDQIICGACQEIIDVE